MLGEKIGGISGKITSQRVLPNLGGAPKMETSFQANGSLVGTDLKDTGTYSSVVRPDGTHYGEGQGVMITKDGKMATWTGHGVGTMKKDESATYRGAIYSQTMPPKLVSIEQGRDTIRIRGGCRGQHTLRLLGMEVTPGARLL